jgi:hypothetical protein
MCLPAILPIMAYGQPKIKIERATLSILLLFAMIFPNRIWQKIILYQNKTLPGLC